MPSQPQLLAPTMYSLYKSHILLWESLCMGPHSLLAELVPPLAYQQNNYMIHFVFQKAFI